MKNYTNVCLGLLFCALSISSCKQSEESQEPYHFEPKALDFRTQLPQIFDTTSVVSMNLFGSVKSMTEYKYNAVSENGKAIKSTLKVKYNKDVDGGSYEFDKTGRMIKKTIYLGTEGNVREERSYFYENNLLEKVSTYMVFSDRRGTATRDYSYDDNNLLVSEVTTSILGKKSGAEAYSYDDHYNVVEKIDVGGIEDSYTQYEYEYQNDYIVSKKEITNGEEGTSHTYQYNEQGALVSETSKWGVWEYLITYNYHENMLLKSRVEICKSPRPFTYTTTYEYNKKNKLVKETLDKGDSIRYEIKEYRNDSIITTGLKRDSIVSKVISFRGYPIENSYDGESKIYEYEYDKNGNWTRCIMFTNSTPTEITERTITYYE